MLKLPNLFLFISSAKTPTGTFTYKASKIEPELSVKTTSAIDKSSSIFLKQS